MNAFFAGRLLLIMAVSVVVKGELANKTINYDTKTKAYVPIWAKCKLLKNTVQVKEQVQKQSLADFKLGVLKNFVNSTEKYLCRSLF